MQILLVGLFTTVLAELSYKHVKESVKGLNSMLDEAELTRKTELRFVSTEMEDRIIRSGSSLELKCEVYSLPPPVVTWTLNGKKIAGTEEANFVEKLLNVGKSTLQNGVVTSRLRIPCVDKKHRGKYRCIVANGHHTVEASAKIAVVGGKRCEASEPTPPQIIQATDSRFEVQNNAVQLMCRVAQRDQAVITWYFLQDDEIRVPLMDDPNFEILSNGDLIVKRCDFETRVGTYLCVASNEYGEDRAEAWLYCNSPSSAEEDT